MNRRDSRDEINQIYEKYRVTVSKRDTTSDSDLQYMIENLKSIHNPYEHPDAYAFYNDVAYGIEHFQISQYVHKKGDQGKAAEAAKQNRDKLKNDREFNLKPSIKNLYDSFVTALDEHMNNADTYKDRVMKVCKEGKIENVGYRLLLVIEDASEQAAYVKKFDTAPRNPFLFDVIANSLIKYEEKLWGVIYIGGNVFDKSVKGYTVMELRDKKMRGELLNIKEFRTMHAEDERVVSMDGSEDMHNVTMMLFDRIRFSD